MELNTKINSMKKPYNIGKNNSNFSSKVIKEGKNSKYDIKKYKILNNFLNKRVKFKKSNGNNDYFTINAVPLNSKKILFTKDDMPYIPSKERQKGELNFIQLIKSLMNSKKDDNSKLNTKQNLVFDTKTKNEDPYKPKGYNYFRYSREHPQLINDNQQYMKILQEINKREENDKDKEKERCLSYNNNINNDEKNNNKLDNDDSLINKISLNKTRKINNIKLMNNTESNKISKNLPISKSCSTYAYRMNNSNSFNPINVPNNLESIKTDRVNLKSKNINYFIDEPNNLPLINSKNFQNSFQTYKNHKINKLSFFKKNNYYDSDIFNLKNENRVLSENNHMPLNNYIDKKTSISEVGWSPNDLKKRSRISISSVAFNILCPNLKSISPMKKDIDLQNNNNIYKSNLMSQFVDMCKPGDSELRKEYKDKLEANKNLFHRKNYCSSYYDIHHEYKDLIIDAF